MDYISPKPNKLNKKKLREMILIFHEETKSFRNKYFKTYDFEAFYKDFLEIKKYLKSHLKNNNKKYLREFFNPVFDFFYSIVYGDWGKD